MVADTGLHSLGWKANQTTDYLTRTACLNKEQADREMTRLASWPGWAAGPVLGEQKIWKLRRGREQRGNFEAKAFHRDVLACRGPLAMLDECVERYEKEGWSGQEFQFLSENGAGQRKLNLITIVLTIMLTRK